MLQKIKSTKLELPPIYLVENEDDFKELPVGIPYIIGTKEDLPFITVYLEFQILFRSCCSTGIPIDWTSCLRRLGYHNELRAFTLNSGGGYWASDAEGQGRVITVDDFIEEQYIVDFDALTSLKILPHWLEDLKNSVEANVIDEVRFNPTAFNKQLGMHIGNAEVSTQVRNLIILDVSGSIPKAVTKTTTALAKLMSKKFFADVMVTSGRTELFPYEKVPFTDFVKVAESFGGNNEGEMYKAIVEQYKEYNTCICFGDDDAPGDYGGNSIRPKFKINTLYSLHTNTKTENIAGYAKLFNPTNVIRVRDWVKTLAS
jgi:hypothetical protein